MAERLPPHDIAAEEAVIGSLLIDGETIYHAATALKPDDFYAERNMAAFGACLALYERGEAINQITIAQELARQGRLETCGGAAYLSYLIAQSPTPVDMESYAQIVARLATLRRLISAGEQITGLGYQTEGDVDSHLAKAEDLLFKLRHGQGQREFVHIRQILDKYFEETAGAEEKEGAPKQLPHVLSGYDGVDEFLGGFQRSDLIILAGRPSMGKTSLALNIARNAAVLQKATVAIFSLEMSRESLVLRLLASEANVDNRRVHLGLQTEEEERRIMDATGILAEAPIYIDDWPDLRMVEMRSRARRLHFERGVDMIVVDYLQLIQGESQSDNRVQEISYISRSLKGLARELNIPVIAVSQLSRAVEWRASHRPQLSDLRESGSIEQDADVVLFVYRDEVYFNKEEWLREHPDATEAEYPPPAELIIAKHRNGPTGTVNLRFQPWLAKFDNIPSEKGML